MPNSMHAATATVEDYHQYAIASALEISQILRALERESSLITASVGGDQFFLTSIVAIDEKRRTFMLERGRGSEHVARVMEKQRLLCSTTLDKIKIQFVCTGIELASHDGEDTFSVRMPQELLRLQRREYYRVTTPLAAPVKCTFSVPQSGDGAAVEMNLIDISCGGIAVMTPHELFTPELGAMYDCVIHLPGTAAVKTRVQARNAFMMKLANGKVAQRSGFAFVNMRESLNATIQRYIMNLERQRKERDRR